MSGPLPAQGYLSNPSRQTQDMQAACELVNSVIKEIIGGAAEASTLSISAGTIIPTNNGCVLPVDAPGGGIIATIDVSNMRDGQLIFLHCVNPSNPITIANLVAGSGVSIATYSGENIVLSNPSVFISLKYNATLNLFQEIFPYPNWSAPGAIGTITPNSGDFTSINLGTPLSVANGGTGQATAPSGSVFGNFSNSTTTPSFNSPGSANQVLGVAAAGGLEYKTIAAGSNITITNTAGEITISSSGGGSTSFPLVNQCRLYGVSGSCYSDTSSSGSSTLYFGACPDRGNSVSLYSSGAWALMNVGSELNISVASLSTGTMYDIYIYNNSGAVAIDTPVAWSNETTPPTRDLQNGVFVKHGDPTRLYVGSIEVISGTVYSYSGNRGIWNGYNRIQKAVSAIDSTNSWTYASTTWRIANGQSSTSYGVAIIRIVTGAQIDSISLTRYSKGPNATYTTAGSIGIGIDNTTGVTTAEMCCTSYTNGGVDTVAAPYSTAQLGAHSYENIESANGTATFYGSTHGGTFGTTWC